MMDHVTDKFILIQLSGINKNSLETHEIVRFLWGKENILGIYIIMVKTLGIICWSFFENTFPRNQGQIVS